jgi:hypothetical protein
LLDISENLAFPYNKYGPSQGLQGNLVLRISLDVPVKLPRPVTFLRARQPSAAALRMLMPKAAMDENYGTVTRQDDIGLAREIVTMDTKPVA